MRKAADRRGSVLAYVLVLALVGCLICTGLAQMRLQPAVTTANAVDRVSADLAETAALNRLTESWARNGVCASDADEQVYCRRPRVPPPPPCLCTCDARGARVASQDRGGSCALTVTR